MLQTNHQTSESQAHQERKSIALFSLPQVHFTILHAPACIYSQTTYRQRELGPFIIARHRPWGAPARWRWPLQNREAHAMRIAAAAIARCAHACVSSERVSGIEQLAPPDCACAWPRCPPCQVHAVPIRASHNSIRQQDEKYDSGKEP